MFAPIQKYLDCHNEDFLQNPRSSAETSLTSYRLRPRPIRVQDPVYQEVESLTISPGTTVNFQNDCQLPLPITASTMVFSDQQLMWKAQEIYLPSNTQLDINSLIPNSLAFTLSLTKTNKPGIQSWRSLSPICRLLITMHYAALYLLVNQACYSNHVQSS